ncbi:hypothetical protein EV379_2385 [Microterricola gilva]|uniref:Uncharacterized protein n=1 Tax=Microterricola gilva TaxID=393267 RepID=A0A4Q8APX3_9MICO|nr:hypothetical protein [Microterricola gilva]RZU66039.1 hypothetical protein EV379_2385 [Microterricola gilva]
MLIVIVCSALALCGLVLMVLWGRLSLSPPDAADTGAADTDSTDTAAAPASAPRARRVRLALRRYLWWATVVTVASFGTALLWTLPASRLIMRALALTSPDATDFFTEAQAFVGTISFEGTLSLFLFGALPGAFLSAVVFAFIYRWLPRGWLGGLIYGLLLLVIGAPNEDPLRPDNPDFGFIEPGWLAVVLFSILLIGQGMLLAAVFGWYSRRLPLRPRRPWLAASPLLATVVYVPIGVVLLIGAGVTALGALVVPSIGRWWVSRTVRWAGLVVLAVLTLIALPGFIGAVTFIASH